MKEIVIANLSLDFARKSIYTNICVMTKTNISCEAVATLWYKYWSEYCRE